MGPATFIALLAALLIGSENVESQRRVIGREPPSTDGWRPVAGSTEQPRYSTQAVGHPVLDKLRAHLEDAERRKVATTPTPSVLASFSAVGPRRDQNAGFSGRLVPPPRDQPPPATFPEDSRDLSAAQQTHPGPYYLHSLLPPPRASDFLLEGPGAGSASSYVSFPPFSSDAYFGGSKQQATQQLHFFPQQPQAQPQTQTQQDAFASLPQRHTYYQQQPQQYQQQQPQQQPDYVLSTQHRQHPAAVSSQYTSHQAIAAASPGLGAGQAPSVFGGREPAAATSRPQGAAPPTHTATAGSVTFHGNIRDEAAYVSASSLGGQGHRFETKRPTASLGNYSPGPSTTTVTQYPQQAVALFQQQAYTPSYAEQPVHTSASVVGFTLGVSDDRGTTAGSQVETPAQLPPQYFQLQQQQPQTFLREQPGAQTNSLQRPGAGVRQPDGVAVADKPGRKRRPSAGQKKPAYVEATGDVQDARTPPQPPPRQHSTYVLQQQYQPETQQNTQQQNARPASWPPTAPQDHGASEPTAPQQVATQQEASLRQSHEGRRRPPQAHQPEASTQQPVQYQEEAAQQDTPRQHARRPPQRQQFSPSARGPTSTPQLEQPAAGGEYRPQRRRRPTQTRFERPAVTGPGEQDTAQQQEAAIRHQQTYYQNTANEDAATAPDAAGEVPSAPSAPASADGQVPREHLRRRPQNKQKYHITMDSDKRTVGSNDWEQTQNTVKPTRPHTRRPVQKQNTQIDFATEENSAHSQPQPTAHEGRPQQRRRPVRPQHRNPPASSLNTYTASENYPQTQRDEETYTNVANRPEEIPREEASPAAAQNQEVEQQVFTRRPSSRYSTTESVVQAAIESQVEGQSSQRTRVRQQHVSRRPAQGSQQEEPTTVAHYRRPLHPSRRPQYKKRVRPTRPQPEYDSEPASQQETTNDPVSQSDNSGDYVQDYRLAELKKVQRQRYKRPQTSQNFAEDVPARTAAVANTAYQLQSSSPLDAEDNYYAVDEQTAPAPAQKFRQRVNQQGVIRGKTKYHREQLTETDTPFPEPTEQVYVEELPVQTESDFENDVLGGGTDARFPSAVDFAADEEDSASAVSEPPATTTTTSTTTSTTTTTTTTPAPSTSRPASTVSSALEKLRQRSRYNATRPRFSVRDFQERLNRLSTSTAAPEVSASETTEAATVPRFSGRTRASTAAPADPEAARPRPAARDPARVNSARYRASTAPTSTTAATPSTRYKYKSRYRSTLSTSTTTEDPTVATTLAAPTPSAIVSRPSLRTKGIFSAVRPNPLLRTATSVATTTSTTTTTTTTTPTAPTTVAAVAESADETPSAPSAPSAPGVFGVRTAQPAVGVDDEQSQSLRIAELTLAAGPRVPSSAAVAAATAATTPASQPPQQTTDLLSAYWAQREPSAPPALSTHASPHYSAAAADNDHPSSAATPDSTSYPATAADSLPDQSSTSHQWSDDAVPPTQMIADLTSSASASDFFQKSVPSQHSLRITMATDDPILPLEAFFPSWGGKEDSNRR
ncbi:mucin-19-like [Schistocerca serialis cubense]|uniref:mucin-19-like n=1 Tax=Schistocerca serialis cubense TaxID=2023355 RepID=UPI00214E8B5D|nr:mucin-19-like [Schistocerca serialis cubense]